MKFFVVTPVRNAADKIARTIESVILQSSIKEGRDTLHYLVMDAASTDGTANEARRVGGNAVDVRSDHDVGMYHALAQALRMADGEIAFYLSAGDVLEPTAFQIVGTVFQKYPQIRWLTGRGTLRNMHGEIVDSLLPHPFHRRFFECGKYGTKLPVLQQESTFWRTTLHTEVDFERLAETTLAGDYLLWKSFARVTDLYVVNAALASFTREKGQLSGQKKGAYRAELRALRRPPSPLEHLAAFAIGRINRHRIPRRSARRLISYNFTRDEWMLSARSRSHFLC